MKLSEIVVLEDQTIPQLHQSIRRGFPKTKKRQHVVHTVSITKLQYTPDTKQDKLTVISSTVTSDGQPHNQMMEVRNVNIQPPNSGNTSKIVDREGLEHSITPAKLNISNVGVFCDCEDYQFRFAQYNIQNNCHIGPNPQNYVKKTDRPPVNPSRVPGMCKHIIKVSDELKDQGILID